MAIAEPKLPTKAGLARHESIGPMSGANDSDAKVRKLAADYEAKLQQANDTQVSLEKRLQKLVRRCVCVDPPRRWFAPLQN